MYGATKPIRRSLLLEYATAVLIERPVATRRLLRSALHNIGLRELRELDQMPEAGALPNRDELVCVSSVSRSGCPSTTSGLTAGFAGIPL